MVDPYKYFRVEAREILDQLGKGILDLEKGHAAPELVQRLLRFAHTLKGAARVVKQREIADHAHTVEGVLAAVREDPVFGPPERIDTLLELLDAISARVAALGPTGDGASTAETPAPSDETFRTLRADVQEIDALIEGVAEARAQLSGVRRGLGLLDRIRYSQALLIEHLRPSRARRTEGAAGVKALAVAEEIGELLSSIEEQVGERAEQMDQELRLVREAAERLRLLPIGLVFNVLERSVRDAAQSVGKRVSFETKGGDVRLDGHVLGIIQNALLQLVRNAVAHGVESEAERKAAGKTPSGLVLLEVARRGSRVSFSCRDDGRGIDVEAVRRAAQRKGLLSAETESLGPKELIALLLKGGLSTSGAVTEVSGRGIGLDVVREAADRLGGEVRVQSEAHKGTTCEIVIPVSLASLEGLLVEAGDQAGVIPLDAVRRTLRVRTADLARTAEGDSIVLEGKVVPFAPLARSLRIAPEPTASRSAWSAVLIESSGALAAVGVDRLLGTESVVLRPLPRLTAADAVVAGAALDAEGNPQIVFDPEALVAEARRVGQAGAPALAQRLPILIVDDSLTTRMLEQSILVSAGYEVDVASSGEEALQKADKRPHALFLVDVEMPGMDGFEFIARIRADPKLGKVPAILVTSRSSPGDRRRGEEVGAQAYIVKSEFDQTDLLARIRKLVG